MRLDERNVFDTVEIGLIRPRSARLGECFRRHRCPDRRGVRTDSAEGCHVNTALTSREEGFVQERPSFDDRQIVVAALKLKIDTEGSGDQARTGTIDAEFFSRVDKELDMRSQMEAESI